MAAPANENVSWSELNEGVVLDDGVGDSCTWSDGDEIVNDDVGGGHGDGGMF